MIKLSLSNAFMLYLGFTLLVLLCLWVYYNLRMRKKTIVPYERYLFQCEYCHCQYLEEAYKAVTQCPECHSFNKVSGR